MRHKHADLIIAWANGAKIQTRYKFSSKWYDVVDTPIWTDYQEYRIKPEPKPDRIAYIKLSMLPVCDTPTWHVTCNQRPEGNNIKATFDGETGKLKSVEIIS